MYEIIIVFGLINKIRILLVGPEWSVISSPFHWILVRILCRSNLVSKLPACFFFISVPDYGQYIFLSIRMKGFCHRDPKLGAPLSLWEPCLWVSDVCSVSSQAVSTSIRLLLTNHKTGLISQRLVVFSARLISCLCVESVHFPSQC
jgi:hypothetical protein